MFENYLRKKSFIKDLSEEDQNILLLWIKETFYTHWIARIIFALYAVIPAIAIMFLIREYRESPVNLTIAIFSLIAYFVFYVVFTFVFSVPIEDLISGIGKILYARIYSTKGKAILPEDFKKIKKTNYKLYNFIMSGNSNGICYFIAFNLLKTLEKGEIKFFGMRWIETRYMPIALGMSTAKPQEKFTMHIIYIKDGWCYDSYTMRQYPADYLLNVLKAEEYLTLSYEDIKDKDYEEFKKEQIPALKAWCEKNNCSQIWSDK